MDLDYRDIFTEYLASKGSFPADRIDISAQSDGSYLAFINYGDEEIETYLGSGFTMQVSFNNVRIDEEENCVVFDFLFVYCNAPALEVDDESNPYMTISLYCEVARAASNLYDRLSGDFDREIWLSLN
jgi:hypothetical protein